MITSRVVRPLCLFLTVLIASPAGFAQTASPATPPARTPTATPTGQVPRPMMGAPLKITILEGNNAINSIPLLRSVAPIVEVRDENEFPIEGASVIFTLPSSGPGGTFATGGTTFTTRTDSHGQAAAPLLAPQGVGKFKIMVSSTSGPRHAEAEVNQTNSTLTVIGPNLHKKPWYKRKYVLLAIGGAVVVTVVAIVLTTGSGSSSGSTVTITPGTPVFH